MLVSGAGGGAVRDFTSSRLIRTRSSSMTCVTPSWPWGRQRKQTIAMSIVLTFSILFSCIPVFSTPSLHLSPHNNSWNAYHYYNYYLQTGYPISCSELFLLCLSYQAAMNDITIKATRQMCILINAYIIRKNWGSRDTQRICSCGCQPVLSL